MHTLLFGVFSLFWTSVALLLADTHFQYSQGKIAVFAFAGATGALVAPIVGKIADKGWSKCGTVFALIIVLLAWLIAKYSGNYSIASLVVTALLLDIGVAANLILSQKALFSLAPEVRGRLTALYTASFYVGGAVGSASVGYLYAQEGWQSITDVGILISIVTLVYFFTEFLKRSKIAI